MRSAIVLLCILMLASLALAQDPSRAPPGSGCFGAGGGGGFGSAPGGPRGNGTGAPPNARRGEGLAELNVTLDPAGDVTLAPGASATLRVALRNDGAAPLALNLTARSGFGGPNATPPIGASLAPETMTLEPGATSEATLTITASPDAPAGCRQVVALRVGEAGTNRSAQARVIVLVPEAAPAPAPATTQAATLAAKASPAHGALAALAGLAGAALLAGRRR